MERSVPEAAVRQQRRSAESKVLPEEHGECLVAMKDPLLRSLLDEYMQEMSNSNNQIKKEQSFAQREHDENVLFSNQLIKPTPGFVVKTTWDNSQKIFINVCSNPTIEPSNNYFHGSRNQQFKTSWKIPYLVGPERVELDHRGHQVPTFDVCFHPHVLEYAQTRVGYQDLVVQTCLEAIEANLRVSRHAAKAVLSRQYIVLQGVSYKSGTPTQCNVHHTTSLKHLTTISKKQWNNNTKAKDLPTSASILSVQNKHNFINLSTPQESSPNAFQSLQETTKKSQPNPLNHVHPAIKLHIPRYQTHETNTCVTYLVQVAHIIESSVQLSFPSSSSLTLVFQASKHHPYQLDIALSFRSIKSTQVHVASENLALLLFKTSTVQPNDST
ncbi:hypothetical protein CCR75_005928 [Bremia lactucae]|uniref:PIH1 N-terminal domain-containing protein n=1 Tax=Bremia lactucae TaxID=4779 RepID=A0A976ILR4_BRELC|nr:hypothetical protein CCR75_005928 [Bremia lactucae]